MVVGVRATGPPPLLPPDEGPRTPMVTLAWFSASCGGYLEAGLVLCVGGGKWWDGVGAWATGPPGVSHTVEGTPGSDGDAGLDLGVLWWFEGRGDDSSAPR